MAFPKKNSAPRPESVEPPEEVSAVLPPESELDPSARPFAGHAEDRVESAKPHRRPAQVEEDEVAIQTPSDKLVAVKPNATFQCVIGNRRYDFQKNVAVTVPTSVREVLANGNRIYP